VSDPLARFARVSPHEGEINACNVKALFSPSVRGRTAEGGRGSLTHHLELELGNTPYSCGLLYTQHGAEAKRETVLFAVCCTA
jgi:hypothetical protein